MKNSKAIPDGYMTVGQMAKKVNVTVRTLQYYDKVGVLKPSAESDGGRRLYTAKDMIRFNQISALKYLGFSLVEIKDKLPKIDTSKEVYELLTHQENELKEQLKQMADILESIEKLKNEVMLIEEVDWGKYASITGSIALNNSSFWLFKHMDNDTYEMLHDNLFDAKDLKGIAHKQNELMERARELQKQGYAPTSPEGQRFAKDLWRQVMYVTKGDLKLLSKMMEFGQNVDEKEWKEYYAFDKDFMGIAIESYLKSNGVFDELVEQSD